MDIKLHKQATTTPKIRAEIQAAPSDITDRKLAKRYGVHISTIRRWRARNDVRDRPHTRHNLLSSLTPQQEEILVITRELLRLGLDDMLMLGREFLNPQLSRSSLHRMLKRRKVPTLSELARQDARNGSSHSQRFLKDKRPGCIYLATRHISVPATADKPYILLVAVERVTHWVHIDMHCGESHHVPRERLEKLIVETPFKIRKMLLEKGRVDSETPSPSGKTLLAPSLFRQTCEQHGIEHYTLDSNIERTTKILAAANGSLQDALTTSRCVAGEALEQTVHRACWLYNHHLPQKALNHRSPFAALDEWRKEYPELFQENARQSCGTKEV